MALPFEPETTDQLRARYALAIADVLDPLTFVDPDQTPGKKRQHVFDCKDGVRLIVSREILCSGVAIHLSASADESRPLYGLIKGGLMGVDEFLRLATRRWQQISGDTRTPRFAFLSPGKGIPHWFVPEKQEAPE